MDYYPLIEGEPAQQIVSRELARGLQVADISGYYSLPVETITEHWKNLEPRLSIYPQLQRLDAYRRICERIAENENQPSAIRIKSIGQAADLTLQYNTIAQTYGQETDKWQPATASLEELHELREALDAELTRRRAAQSIDGEGPRLLGENGNESDS